MERTLDISAQVDSLNAKAYEIRNTDTREAIRLCDEAIRISEKENYDAGKAQALSHKGFCYVQLADYSQSLTHLHEALRIFTGIGHEEGLASVNYNLGLVFMRMGDFNMALEYELRSLTIREKLDDEAGAANCYMQIGYVYEHFSDLENALRNYEKGLILHRKVKYAPGEAALLMGIASIYIIRNDHEKVKHYLEECLRVRKTIHDPRGYGATMHRYTSYHIQNENYAEARKTVEEGLTVAENVDDKMGQCRLLVLLGKILTRQQQYDGSIAALEKAGQISIEIRLKSVEFEIHLALSEVYELMGDDSKALEHYKLYQKKKEEVLSADVAVKVRNIETIRQMESANKEAEIHRLRNVELKKAYEEIEQKNKDILDSIRYAQRIQNNILPTKKYIDKNLKRLAQGR